MLLVLGLRSSSSSGDSSEQQRQSGSCPPATLQVYEQVEWMDQPVDRSWGSAGAGAGGLTAWGGDCGGSVVGSGARMYLLGQQGGLFCGRLMPWSERLKTLQVGWQACSCASDVPSSWHGSSKAADVVAAAVAHTASAHSLVHGCGGLASWRRLGVVMMTTCAPHVWLPVPAAAGCAQTQAWIVLCPALLPHTATAAATPAAGTQQQRWWPNSQAVCWGFQPQ